jgi:hypothetical protein
VGEKRGEKAPINELLMGAIWLAALNGCFGYALVFPFGVLFREKHDKL